jgi:hypothetical protein
MSSTIDSQILFIRVPARGSEPAIPNQVYSPHPKGTPYNASTDD